MPVILLTLLALTLPLAAVERLGKPLRLNHTLSVETLMSDPAPHLNKTVQVKGKVTEVCEKMGCWMNLVDWQSGKRVRIKVTDGELVIPKSSIGKAAVAEGTLMRLELTREQAVARARHEAEEQGRSFDPASVSSGATFYQIRGAGIVIID